MPSASPCNLLLVTSLYPVLAVWFTHVKLMKRINQGSLFAHFFIVLNSPGTKLQNRLCICAPESRPIPMRVNVQLLVANKEFFSPKRKDRGPQNCKSERPGLRAYGLWQQCLRASKSRSLDDLSCNAFRLRHTSPSWQLHPNSYG